MYLDIHSFYARVKHEGLYKSKQMFGKSVYTGEFDEEFILDILQTYKDFNKNKDVIYTCVNVDNAGEDVYKNTAWFFAYRTLEEQTAIQNVIDNISETTTVKVTVIGPAECPFKNNGELV